MIEQSHLTGVYEISVFERGSIIFRTKFDNVVCTGGKNLALGAFLTPSSYQLVGPYLGLISGLGFVSVSPFDTMTSHPGWNEAGVSYGPTYGTTRPNAVFDTPNGGQDSFVSPLTFSFTGPGILQGAFLSLGPGASSVVGSAGGTLYSAGVFSSPQPVSAQNTVTINYTASL